MPAREGRGLELEAVSLMPLPGCSVRPFAGANCPHRTPLICVFWTAGNTAEEISLVQIILLFYALKGFLHDFFGIVMIL